MNEPTELAGIAKADTEMAYAYSLDETEEIAEYRPRRVTALALGGALVVIAAAGVVAVMHVRKPVEEPVVASRPSVVVSTVTVTPEPSPKPSPAPAPPEAGPWFDSTETAAMRKPPPEPEPEPEPEAPSGSVSVNSPDPRDPEFLTNLQAKGWTIWDRPLITLRAHQICGALQQGMSPGDASANAVATMGVTPYEAMVLVATVRETYPNCR